MLEAAKKYLGIVAAQVFDRYAEAPVRVNTNVAERFLRMPNLNAITSDIDPLGLVQIKAGMPQINIEHKAIISIRDMLDRQGSMDGKRLADIFAEAPFGWSSDTLRYLVAAMLLAGELSIKVAGKEITVNGTQTIEALKNNNSFKNVGISLRDERPSIETMGRAAHDL